MPAGSRQAEDARFMRSNSIQIICAVLLTLGMAGIATAQDNATEPPASQVLPAIQSARSIDQELDHLTKNLELTPNQQKQIRPLLQRHHDQIQALLDKNPSLTREQLGPQIHAISDKTHRQIDALLTPRQKELSKAMQKREQDGEENRRSVPPPAQPSPVQPFFDPTMVAS
jgi:periplasmic protein CpxP/Spy